MDHRVAGGGGNRIRQAATVHQGDQMSIRFRKLMGAAALLALVLGWLLLAMAVAQFPVLWTSLPLEIGFYVIAGLGWVLLAMPIIRWGFGGQRSEVRDQMSDKSNPHV
jgi:Protein of unknown function (DUF2842)